MFRALATCLFLVPTVANAEYVGNVHGSDGKYRVFEFTDDGQPWRPVSGVSFLGVAWPSAVKIGTTVDVYASDLTSSGWTNIRKWRSVNGAAYTSEGVVLSANSSEPYGIGPATVTYDGTTWRLFYTIRGAFGSSNIALATSTNGTNFTRQGNVYTDSSIGGISLSYACSDDGDHYLFIHAYNDTQTAANSAVIKASDPDGPYSYLGTTVLAESITGTFSGTAGNSFGAVSGTMPPVGSQVVVGGDDPEVYRVVSVTGSYVYLDRPLVATVSGVGIKTLASGKADLSFVRKTSTVWTGAMTAYGHYAGKLSEYTAPISASSITGPWAIEPGYFLNPYFNSGRDSTENPEPFRTDSGC